MRLFWLRFRGLFRANYAYMTEYRAELILWALANSLSFILMGVWFEAAGRATFALSSLDVVRYFLAVFVVRQLTIVYVIWALEEQVVQGKLAPILLQPIDPVWRHLMSHVAERVARAPFSVALIALFFVIYPAAWFVPSPSTLVAFLSCALAAFCLRFALQYTVAMGCFWTERASSIEMVMFLFYMFFGGAIAPLDFFPAEFMEVILYTPFPYMIWFPCKVLMGTVGNAELLKAAMVMGAWFVVVVVVNRLLWRAGLRRFSAMGA
jgi:ABC-2 type transport system permease protein